MSDGSSHHEDSRTSATLLHRLRLQPGDESAWKSFVSRYEPLVLRWCRRHGLKEDNARDVAQNVMLRLTRVMEEFEYDSTKSFRAWLKTITHHAWYDWSKKETKHTNKTEDSELLGSLEARDELVEQLQDEFNAEVMEFAILRIRMRVSQASWRAFELTAIQGMRGVEVASMLNVDVGRVYVDKSRITKMLAAEVRQLDPEAKQEEKVRG